MATAIFTNWFKNNSGTLDATGREIGLTLFTRCPVLAYAETDGAWTGVASLNELLESDHWQAPSYFAQDESGAFVTLQQTVAATAEYSIDFTDGQYYLKFADEDGFVIGTSPAWGESEESPTGVVIKGLALWYEGAVGDVERPVLVMIQLDRPVLLMATDDQPTRVKAPLVMSWSTPTPGVGDARYGMATMAYGDGTYGGGS